MPVVIINEKLTRKFITHKGALDFCDRIFREGKDKARILARPDTPKSPREGQKF